jgi:hypothetical protein
MISHLYANYAIHKSHWVVELAVNLVNFFLCLLDLGIIAV